MAEYKRSSMIAESSSGYCPGCLHSLATRLVSDVLDELGQGDNSLNVISVGCSALNILYWGGDFLSVAHGRAPAAATGIKRTNPDTFVFTYQGDGDLASIGLAETMSAANRGENISVIFINNGIYGMTGGQMAPTTLLGMKATTAPKGRDPKEHGYPMHMCEILDKLTAPVYLERTSCNTPQNLMHTKSAIKKAFVNQLEGRGFSMVEIVTTCPTNWGMDALGALDYLEKNMLAEFPLGLIRDRTKEA